MKPGKNHKHNLVRRLPRGATKRGEVVVSCTARGCDFCATPAEFLELTKDCERIYRDQARANKGANPQ